MRNAAFCLLTEPEKSSKFRAILNEKTERTLTGEEMRSILLCVSPHRQYSIKVHSDADRFREVLQLSNGFRGKTVLGQVLVSHDNTRGELYCPAQPAAIILNNLADESRYSPTGLYSNCCKGPKVVPELSPDVGTPKMDSQTGKIRKAAAWHTRHNG